MKKQDLQTIRNLLSDYVFVNKISIENNMGCHSCPATEPRECLCIGQANEMISKLEEEIGEEK